MQHDQKLCRTVHQKPCNDTKTVQQDQQLCNGTKNCTMTSTTVQRHQKLWNSTNIWGNGTKTVQQHQEWCNGTKNRCSPDYQFGNVKCPPLQGDCLQVSVNAVSEPKFSSISKSSATIFSVTRRSRNDVFTYSLPEWWLALTWLMWPWWVMKPKEDLIYVTLVSEDTFSRLDWCDSGEWRCLLGTWLM